MRVRNITLSASRLPRRAPRPADLPISNYLHCNELAARDRPAHIRDAGLRLANALDADFLLLWNGNYGTVRAP
jgi:hypothetical protein